MHRIKFFCNWWAFGNWSYLGGAVATYGTIDISLHGVKALGNEANASTGGKEVFLQGTGAVLVSLNCIFGQQIE